MSVYPACRSPRVSRSHIDKTFAKPWPPQNGFFKWPNNRVRPILHLALRYAEEYRQIPMTNFFLYWQLGPKRPRDLFHPPD